MRHETDVAHRSLNSLDLVCHNDTRRSRESELVYDAIAGRVNDFWTSCSSSSSSSGPVYVLKMSSEGFTDDGRQSCTSQCHSST